MNNTGDKMLGESQIIIRAGGGEEERTLFKGREREWRKVRKRKKETKRRT